MAQHILDVEKLHTLPTEQQSLFLLSFTSDLAAHAESLGDESQEQAPIKAECFKIISLKPSRVTRKTLARCFAALYKTNRRTLHETINELTALLAIKEQDVRIKHAAVYCLGVVFEVAGDSAINLATHTSATLLKLKAEVGLKAAVYRALGRISRAVTPDEDLARTLWKSSRSALQDRSHLVSISASWCLEQLATTAYFDTSSDFEKLQNALIKAMDSPSAATRHAAASCLATWLIKSLNAPAMPKAKKAKKIENEPERSESPAPNTTLSHTLQDVLRILGVNYTKSTSSNRVRASIARCYISIIKSFSMATLEESYNEVARFLLEFLAHGSLPFNRYRLLITRKFVDIILAEAASFGEAAQLNACRFLVKFLNEHTIRPSPAEQTLIGALQALNGLILNLGGAVSAVSDTRDMLLQLHQQSSFAVQVHASIVLKSLLTACPQLIASSLDTYRGRLEEPGLTSISYAYAVCAILTASAEHPLYAVDYAGIMSQALSLLKLSATSDLHISACQVQVAYLLISGLMPLGPEFMRPHLQQLLLLWKNATKPPPNAQRTLIDLCFLAHVRECALTCVRAFLTFNSRLLTNDVSRRLAAILETSVAFISALPEKKTSDDPATRLFSFSLQDYDTMVTRRIMQCFSLLLESSPDVEPNVYATIFPLAIKSFSSPEYHQSLITTIATSTKESIWEAGDNYGFGVTSMAKPTDVGREDDVVYTPICSASEYAPMSCFMTTRTDPPTTEVVNASIMAFAVAFPAQSSKVQESILSQIEGSLSASNGPRHTAIAVNIALALHMAAERSAMRLPSALLRQLLAHPDDTVRHHASAAMAKCDIAEITWLTETIVKNPDPCSRAGCAQALAAVYASLGMSAVPHLRQIAGILLSLAADSHPLVHYAALDGLARVADSAGLNFPHVNGAIGTLSQLYASDTHNAEIEVLAASNMLVDMSVAAAIARAVASLINVLGPDLQDMTKASDMILTLMRLFLSETDIDTVLANLKCQDHLSLYTPNTFDIASYIDVLRKCLESQDTQQTALENLCSVLRRDSNRVTAAIEERLWELLDNDPQNTAIRQIFANWLHQSSEPVEWISRCSKVLSAKSNSSQAAATSVKETTIDQDEEVAGFNVTATKDITAQDLRRWQVRLFALECLYNLISTVKDDSGLEQHVGDVIRLAFSASTAGVTSIRLVGLKIIDQILKTFGRTPDPDFNEAMLLEQYQAQISSALTPAFAADSSPQLAAEAINVCATFLATGIVTDVDRMGRTLKILVSALELRSSSIGDLTDLGSNAQVMIKMATLSAWAELQVASADLKYLQDVVGPYVEKLVPLWLGSLREYARLRFEDDEYNRLVLLSFYQDAWLSLVDAVASLIDRDSEFVFAAMDEQRVDYHSEPVAFFFVLFGLTFEALSKDDPRKIEILRAVQKIIRPSVAGDAIYSSIFEETVDLMHRMALTESLRVQTVIVAIATDLCMAHPSTRHQGDLSEDIEQLFELTRIMVLVLSGVVPGLADTPTVPLTDEAIALVHAALQALVEISDVFPTIIRTDLRDAILHVFVVILGTASCQSVVPQTLPMFRRLISSMAGQPLPHTTEQLNNALSRMLSILANARQGDSEASLACERNVLLGCALLVSSAHTLVDSSAYVEALVVALHGNNTQKVAAGCVRTLLAAGVAEKRLTRETLLFLTSDADEESKALIAQTLVIVVRRRPELLRLALEVLLRNGDKERIIDLSNVEGFREVVTSKRSAFQKVLNSGAVEKRAEEKEPTIALKLTF